MVVRNTGYVKSKDLLKIGRFLIYETSKKTHILVKHEYTPNKNETFYKPKEDRLPWKIVEGKSICVGKMIFDSKVDDIGKIDYSKWNNGEQIMSYEDYS